jgi:hypothetical protein
MIKLDKDFMRSPFWHSPEGTHIFIKCLLSSDHPTYTTRWGKGVYTIERGQFQVSPKAWSREMDISKNSLRYWIDKLIEWGYLTGHPEGHTLGRTGGFASVYAINPTFYKRHTSKVTRQVSALPDSASTLDINSKKLIKKEKIIQEGILRGDELRAEMMAFATSKGFPAELGAQAFEYYEAMGWKDNNGKPVKSWKGKLIGVWFKPDRKLTTITKENLWEPQVR